MPQIGPPQSPLSSNASTFVPDFPSSLDEEGGQSNQHLPPAAANNAAVHQAGSGAQQATQQPSRMVQAAGNIVKCLCLAARDGAVWATVGAIFGCFQSITAAWVEKAGGNLGPWSPGANIASQSITFGIAAASLSLLENLCREGRVAPSEEQLPDRIV